MQRLKRETECIKPGVDEFLRFLSPNQFGNRLCVEDVEISGHKIPAGTNFHLCIGAANRDGSVFENPNALQLNRRPNPHLAFAGGPHLCVGFSLARMEGRIAISRFLERFPDYQLKPGAELGGRIRFRGYAKLPASLNA